MGSGYQKDWGVISSPCCCTAPAGMHMPSIIQRMEGISCCVSQEPAAPAAASTTAREALDGTVSPAMLTSPRKGFPCLLPPLRDIAAPSLLDNGEGVKGDGSPRQGAGSVWVMGLFLSQIKHSSPWADELWSRGRCPNSTIFWDAGPSFQVFNRSYSPELQPEMRGMVLGAL